MDSMHDLLNEEKNEINNLKNQVTYIENKFQRILSYHEQYGSDFKRILIN